jgi:uncharacterized protein (DUF1684 family)
VRAERTPGVLSGYISTVTLKKMKIVVGLFAACTFAVATDSYMADVELWRNEREDRLKTDSGELSFTGLYWLKPGENAVGSHPSSRVLLPARRGPLSAGTITWQNGKVTFRAAGRLKFVLNGQPDMLTVELRTDKEARPDVIHITPDLMLRVTERGSRLGVEVRDRQSKLRQQFKTLRWYPIRREWLLRGRFVPYSEPRKVSLATVAGDTREWISDGYVEFTAAGKQMQLIPVRARNSILFVFRDATAGKTTYSHARFLYADPPSDGNVMLDFNKAQNPPSVFTPHAECLLPPKENSLDIAVEAGEMMYEPRSFTAAQDRPAEDSRTSVLRAQSRDPTQD